MFALNVVLISEGESAMRRSGLAISVCVCVGAVLIPAVGRSQRHT
jgi:hypothetical protein